MTALKNRNPAGYAHHNAGKAEWLIFSGLFFFLFSTKREATRTVVHILDGIKGYF